MGFVAYALPGGKDWTCLKGEWESLGENNSAEKGFIVSNFIGDKFILDNSDPVAMDYNFFANSRIPDSNEESKETYLENVDKLIQELHCDEYKKIVYSRSKLVSSNRPFSEVIDALLNEDSSVFRYVMIAPNNEIWMGASPEVLIAQKNGIGRSMALAGTQKNLDIKLKEYVWGVKEVEEHEYVVDYISNVFKKCNLSFEKDERATSLAGPVVHLKTSFKNITPLKDLIGLFTRLHPTPAVCGIPKEKTKSRIIDIETRDRSYYTGLIGVISEEDSSVFVNLRSMKRVQQGYELFVGGGITKESDAVSEWNETELKSQTLMKLIFNSDPSS